jgi:HSP20 family protein
MAEAATMQRAKEGASVKLTKGEDIFDRLQKLSDSISRRAFEIFESNGGIFGRDLDDWFRAESEVLHPVHIDLTESDSALAVRAEVPGFSAKELQVSLEPGGRLTIAGKRETKEERKGEKTVYRERCADEILRVIDLPSEVDADKTTGGLKDGVLTLEMPKAAPAKKVPIEPEAA